MRSVLWCTISFFFSNRARRSLVWVQTIANSSTLFNDRENGPAYWTRPNISPDDPHRYLPGTSEAIRSHVSRGRPRFANEAKANIYNIDFSFELVCVFLPLFFLFLYIYIFKYNCFFPAYNSIGSCNVFVGKRTLNSYHSIWKFFLCIIPKLQFCNCVEP